MPCQLPRPRRLWRSPRGLLKCSIDPSRSTQVSSDSRALLERILGHFPFDIQRDLIEHPQLAAERLKAAEGAQELMVFSVFDHGAALNLVGARTNAKQYLIGNPLTAIQMSQHDIRAALYAPLRVLVYEQGEGHTIVEHDQPSSQFGQFGLTDVTQVAMTLDVKLERVLVQGAELSRVCRAGRGPADDISAPGAFTPRRAPVAVAVAESAANSGRFRRPWT